MNMAEIARSFGVKPSLLAGAMGVSRQWMNEIRADRCRFSTLEKVCDGLAKMGVTATPLEIFELLQAESPEEEETRYVSLAVELPVYEALQKDMREHGETSLAAFGGRILKNYVKEKEKA